MEAEASDPHSPGLGSRLFYRITIIAKQGLLAFQESLLSLALESNTITKNASS